MIEQQISYPDFKRFKDEFRQLDKAVQKETKDGIKSSIRRVTSGMQSRIRSEVKNPPMSGMSRGDKWRWVYPNVKPSLTLSAGPGKRVAQIVAKGKGGYDKMFAITERAGSRTPGGFTKRGARMNRVLNKRNELVKGKGGRYVFRSFLAERGQMHDEVERQLNALANKLNVRLRRG